MKKTANMIIKETTESAELSLYALNTAELFPLLTAKVKMLQRKINKGIYNHEKAIEAIYPVATAAAQMYEKEFCNIPYYVVFDVTARWTAADDMLQYLEDMYLEF